jgi:hypothetical protein
MEGSCVYPWHGKSPGHPHQALSMEVESVLSCRDIWVAYMGCQILPGHKQARGRCSGGGKGLPCQVWAPALYPGKRTIPHHYSPHLFYFLWKMAVLPLYLQGQVQRSLLFTLLFILLPCHLLHCISSHNHLLHYSAHCFSDCHLLQCASIADLTPCSNNTVSINVISTDHTQYSQCLSTLHSNCSENDSCTAVPSSSTALWLCLSS